MFDFKRQQEITIVAEEDFKTPKTNSENPSSKDSKKIDTGPVRKEQQQIQPKVHYDTEIIQGILSQSNRYKNLKPTALLKVIGDQPNYEYLKKIAVSHLEENIRKQFAIFSRIVYKKLDDEEEIQNDRLSHGVFSWRWSDFLERRKEESFVWVDILLRKNENQLYYLKFSNDMKELQFFLDKIFHGFLLEIGKQNDEIRQHLSTTIDEAKKALYIMDNIEKEFCTNSRELQFTVYKEYLFADAKRNSEEKFLKNFLENRICNSHVLEPIEIRYQLNWFDSLVKQNQYYIERTTNTYQTDTSRYTELENLEQFANGSCLDYYYSSIELYKNRINEFQNKYDKENEDMETKLSLLRIQIEKTKEQRNWLLSEIQRFQDEVKEISEHGEINAINGEEK